MRTQSLTDAATTNVTASQASLKIVCLEANIQLNFKYKPEPAITRRSMKLTDVLVKCAVKFFDCECIQWGISRH